MLDLIKKDQECEIDEQHNDLQKKQYNPANLLGRKKWLAEIFKKPTSSHELRAEDIAAKEIVSTYIPLVLK